MKKIIALLMMLFMLTTAWAASDDWSQTAGISISLVNQDPDPVAAGEIVEVRIGIENIGGRAVSNLMMEIDPAYPFELVPGEDVVQDIGTMQGYQTGDSIKIIKFKVRVDRDATAGSYDLKIKYYEQGSTAISTKSLSVDVRNSESAEVIHIDKTNLVPGKQTSLKFTVNNVGNAPLREMTFYWENEDKIILPVGSDNRRYIKYVDVSEGAELEYQVIADSNAEPGLYELNLYLTYDDPLTGEDKEIATIAGVYVGGGTDFDVSFSEGTSSETSFSIANIGSNPAYSVSVIIPEQDGWTVSGSNSAIIGNLNKGDYTVATFTLQSGGRSFTAISEEDRASMTREELMALRSNAQSSGTVKVQIAYTDTMGERNVVEKEVAINPTTTTTTTTTAAGTVPTQFNRGRVVQQQSFFEKYKWHMLITVLVIFGVFAWKYRKMKKVNPEYKVRDLFKFKRRKK